MKKTLMTVLVFALILAALMGLSALWERVRPAEEAAETTEPAPVIVNEMTPDSATVIRLADDRASILGAGATWTKDAVTIGYPGTYRISGSLAGQLIVDLGEFGGAVYLILDGADIVCAEGPALYIKQADLTVIQLTADTVSRFQDGADYGVMEAAGEQTGAVIYSADDLVIQGDGALTVTGYAADGVRSKDSLTVTGGILQVYSADDGLQASDYAAITGGDITIGAYGDGVRTTEGYVEISGGSLAITSGGDGIDAAGDILVSGGAVSVLAYGGPENYAAAAEGGISARGLKGQNVTVLNGALDLSSADDGIHARADAVIAGGSVTIASGDDGVCAGGAAEILGGELVIVRSYEALQGETVALYGGMVTASAESNGVDAGEGGLAAENAVMVLAAPRGVSAEGPVALRGGVLRMEADGTDSLFAFGSAEVNGCDLLVVADSGTAESLMEKGELPGSLLYVFQQPVSAGTEFVLSGASGEEILAFVLEKDAGAVLLASGALMEGQTYTMTAGERSAELVFHADSCAVYEEEPAALQSGGWGFPGRPGGGPGGPSR